MDEILKEEENSQEKRLNRGKETNGMAIKDTGKGHSTESRHSSMATALPTAPVSAIGPVDAQIYSQMLGSLATGFERHQASQQLYYNYFYQALMAGQGDFRSFTATSTTAPSHSTTSKSTLQASISRCIAKPTEESRVEPPNYFSNAVQLKKT